MRRAAPASALVEKHDPVSFRIKRPPVPRRASRPRSAVQNHSRLPSGIPTCLPVQPVAAANVEHAVGVGVEWGIKDGHWRIGVME